MEKAGCGHAGIDQGGACDIRQLRKDFLISGRQRVGVHGESVCDEGRQGGEEPGQFAEIPLWTVGFRLACILLDVLVLFVASDAECQQSCR